MGSFIENFHDENALRKFALLNAKSIVQQMIDDRSQNAVAIAEAYLNGEVSQNDLERAYSDADAAHDKIVAAHMSDNDPTQSEETAECAALVAMWAVYPVGHTGVSPISSARDAALHTAYYCFHIKGLRALEEQIPRFRESGLIQ